LKVTPNRPARSLPTVHSLDELAIHVRDVELATLASYVPNAGAYSIELKFDGYRMLAFVGADGIRLVSRNHRDWTATFSGVLEAIAQLDAGEAILDGELCIVDARGVPRFQRMQRRGPTPRNAVYVAFDLLWHHGDLRGRPLEERRKRLAQLLAGHGPALAISSAVEGDPMALLALARTHGLEGIVLKRKGSLYVGGRSRDWLKMKVIRRQAFAVIGYRPMAGTRTVGSLLLALSEGKGGLVYAGRVGTGFDERQRRELARMLDARAASAPAARGVPTLRPTLHWSEPGLVVEVEFLEWTDDGRARHPTFRGIRLDKAPTDCVRGE
jgi:bifunctional non-homologous end joining protein LigD